MQPHNTTIDLRCTVEVEGSKATVRFSAKNLATEDVYLYDEGPEQHPDLICDAGDGAVNVLLGIAPLPPWPVLWKYHPEATRLGPGQSKHGSFVLDLPLREKSSYYNDDYTSLRTIHVGRLRLLLDYVRSSSAGFTMDPAPRGTPECAACEVPADLLLERRDDAFDRRGTTVR